MKKYYFVYTVCEAYGSTTYMPQAFVTDKHPFERVSELNKTVDNYVTTIQSWQEITKEEYDLYIQLEL